MIAQRHLTRRMRRFGATVILAAIPLSIVQATAQTPQLSRTPFGDWVLRCQAAAGGAKICEVAQTIAVKPQKDQKQPQFIAEIVFGKLNKTQPMFMVTQVPLGAWLPAGATVTADKLPAIRATFTRCAQTCMAEIALTPANLTALKGESGPGRLLIEDGAQHSVTLPLSFKGLSQALAARDKAVS